MKPIKWDVQRAMLIGALIGVLAGAWQTYKGIGGGVSAGSLIAYLGGAAIGGAILGWLVATLRNWPIK